MLVFVYGTLMRGKANHSVLVRMSARFVGSACTVDARTVVDLGPYPALLPSDRARDAKASTVRGEIFEVDDGDIDALDAFEGAPALYRRERISVTLVDAMSEPIETCVYVLAGKIPGA
jgi:gamma-glutamylcyclotransferase (GGCT)/AIG2-like uncharacterized protein YtfP